MQVSMLLASTETDKLQEIIGPRYRCRKCLDFDYCFMCRPFLGHLHQGHRWDVIYPPNLPLAQGMKLVKSDEQGQKRKWVECEDQP